MIFVTEGRDAKAVKALACRSGSSWLPSRTDHLGEHRHVARVHQGRKRQLPNAQITFDKFHVVGHANAAVDKTRRIEQRTEKSLKGMRGRCSRMFFSLKPTAGAALHGLITHQAHTDGPRVALHL
ncbi:transposase [Xanthomonas oryzae]|uniref:transposase n=1 Tax=Xanthomonas oryzae TaxID=347 RepID=UPI002221F9C6|nr:transposase [Xanthomonas oryzae]